MRRTTAAIGTGAGIAVAVVGAVAAVAEWTGGSFDPTGQRFYVSIQHNATANGLVLDITGWS